MSVEAILAGQDTIYSNATTTKAGLMSASDKVKLNGIATGATANSPYTSVPNMDGTANPGSSNLYSKGDHIHPTDTSRLPVIGKGINLLDNWYFVGGGSQQGGGQFPINQRGQTSYNGAGYTIDRWILPTSAKLSIQSGSIRNVVAAVSTGNIHTLRQMVKFLPGTYTVSILVKECTGTWYLHHELNDERNYIRIGTDLNKVSLVSQTFSTSTTSNSGFVSIFNNHPDSVTEYIDIIAVKLELGDQQTLAHQDANGNWVLNDPPPNYQQELAKCQRYYCEFKTRFYVVDAAGWFIPLNAFPVPMRGVPTITFKSSNGTVNKLNDFYTESDTIDIIGSGISTNFICGPVQLDSPQSTTYVGTVIADANL